MTEISANSTQSNFLFLIIHKVNGAPALDIAESINYGTPSDPAPWWLIPTSGHRAYPYRYWKLVDFKEVAAALGTYRRGPDWDALPDHYPKPIVTEPPEQKSQWQILLSYWEHSRKISDPRLRRKYRWELISGHLKWRMAVLKGWGTPSDHLIRNLCLFALSFGIMVLGAHHISTNMPDWLLAAGLVALVVPGPIALAAWARMREDRNAK